MAWGWTLVLRASNVVPNRSQPLDAPTPKPVLMKYGSVCSGIEAASVAWHDLGWEPQWFSEIEQFPSEVLKYRFPHVPNLGDMTTINQNPIADERPIDLLVGGTPCQSFSVAGLRKGLADPRGNLMLTFLSIADKFRPKWVVWENVPGVLSSNGGRDFGTFLGALGELGYGFSYRVLDAQHFGVAQRRRRVFVVGYLGDWRVAAAVLFERESLQGNTKPSRKKREEVTANAEGSVGDAGDVSCVGGNLSPTVTSKWKTGYGGPSGSNETGNMVYAQPIGINGNIAGTIDANYFKGCGSANFGERDVVAQPMAFDWQSGGDMRGMNLQEKTQLQRCQTPAVMHSIDFRNNRYNEEQIAGTLQSKESGGYSLNYTTGVHQPPMAIRRLTPKECERLQGFPDDWTKIPYRNKPADQCPDGPRYKACGNSMAVPVMRWIGERINLIESIL
jgi:DNA (cytosine-5)-methyltransferase 1